MVLKNHIIVGAIGAVAVFPLIGPLRAIVFFLSSVLIDSDHYIDYLWRTRKQNKFPAGLSPKAMFKYYDQFYAHQFDKRQLGFSLFHTVEIFIVVYLLSIFVHYGFLDQVFFLTVLAGMAYHMIFDVISLAWIKLHFIRAYSIVEYFIRFKKMLRRGVNPNDYSKEMFSLSRGSEKK